MLQLIRVAVPCPLYHAFDYLCETQPPIGARVQVPFGFRKAVGIVIAHLTHTDLPHKKLKPITTNIDQASLFPADLLALLLWIADYYHYPIGEVFATALPTALRQGKACQIPQQLVWRATLPAPQGVSPKRGSKQEAALQYLASEKKTRAQLSDAQITMATVNALVKKGLVLKETLDTPRLSASMMTHTVRLNLEQTQAVYHIQQHAGKFAVLLLEGITGSGKTEVYIHSISPYLKQAKQALVLVPEIGLTPQLLERFESQLSARILAYHSNISDKQRLEAWAMVQQGLVDIVIGTRSAIFLPFIDLGIIIVDEEHDASFKQMEGLRYHARDLGVRRAQLIQIPVVLGSATPSLESLYNLQQHRYKGLYLQQRAGHAPLPTYRLINLREEHSSHGLSDSLKQAIGETVARNEQVLLFLNRRGFSPVYFCHDCTWIAKCLDCDAPLTLHQTPRYLHCHHCDKHYHVVPVCPDCHSSNLHSLGLGTQRIEQAIEETFPQYKVVRIDRDVTRKKGDFDHKLTQIHTGDAQILIGTQMLAKGHHFPNVTLVGVINADSSFHCINFRAIEQIGQLLVQVAGRAGRAEKSGRVLIQTYQPQNEFLQCLITQGYPAFAQALLRDRARTRLPPIEYAVLIRAEGKKSDAAMALLQKIRTLAQSSNDRGIRLLGPAASTMERRAGWHRAQLLLQSEQRKNLHQLTGILVQFLSQQKSTRDLRWSIDVDPRE